MSAPLTTDPLAAYRASLCELCAKGARMYAQMENFVHVDRTFGPLTICPAGSDTDLARRLAQENAKLREACKEIRKDRERLDKVISIAESHAWPDDAGDELIELLRYCVTHDSKCHSTPREAIDAVKGNA